jgi:hypothetical protein
MIAGYFPSSIGANTSAHSTRPSLAVIPWCQVIFMPSRISVRA